MTFIIIIVFWLIGLAVTSFTLIPIFIILLFGIPTTKKLEGMKMLKENNGITKRYLISLTILSVIFSATILITLFFFKNGLIGLLVGVGMTFLFGLGQTRKNKNNISDYVEVNKQYFLISLEKVADVIAKL